MNDETKKTKKPTYAVSNREFGRGPAERKRFASLAALQQYVRDRWQGVEYIDGPQEFHSDYCTFRISGATLKDLGRRESSDPATDEYWYWRWHDLGQLTKSDLSQLSEGENA